MKKRQTKTLISSVNKVWARWHHILCCLMSEVSCSGRGTGRGLWMGGAEREAITLAFPCVHWPNTPHPHPALPSHICVGPSMDPAISSIPVWFQQEAGVRRGRRLPLSWDFRLCWRTRSILHHKGHWAPSPSQPLIVHQPRWFTFNSGGYFSRPQGREALKACLEGIWIMYLRDSSPEAGQEPYFS